MSDVLILFGFSWIVFSALIGLLVGLRHEPHLEDLGNLARRGDLHGYHVTLDAFKWRVTVHAHGMLFSLVSIVIGLCIPKMAYPQLVTDALAVVLMASSALWTLAGFRSVTIAMGIADLMFLASVLTTVVGLARAIF